MITRSTYSGNPIWDILGISCIYEQEAESSILLVNRKMKNVNDALKVSMFLQSEWKLYSRLVPDPFDLFRLVFRSLEASYHMITDIPALVGNDYKYQFCGRSLVHFYPRRGSETPKEANLILLKLLDNEKDRIHEGTMQFFQYYPNYISNYAWIGIKEKCHQLKQYNSNYFTGIPPRTTVFKAIVPGLNMKLNAMANRASRLTT